MDRPRRIDDCLSVRDGRLFVEDCDSLELLRRFGSPLFVFSEDQLRRNARRFQAAFEREWAGPVQLLPAAKANWLPAVLRVLAQEGCGSDVYSPGELKAALAAGTPPERISVNGVPKSREHVRAALEAGARLTVDSLEELDDLEAAAASLPRPARVRLRLKPLPAWTAASGFAAEGLVAADIAATAYKGGLPFEAAVEAGRRVLKMRNVELVGAHQHHGRHDRSTRWWRAQMTAYAEELGRLARALGGWRPRELDIGGGFAVPRDPFNAATHYSDPFLFGGLHLLGKALEVLGMGVRRKAVAALLGPIASEPNRTPAPSAEDYARAVCGTLREELPRQGLPIEGLVLQLEPGRSLHGDAGLHLATVTNVKRNRGPVPWTNVVTDTTEFWLAGGRFEHHLHAFLFANKPDAPAAEVADVNGRSCYADRILGRVRVPAVEPGDVLALLDAGSYQEGSASNFNALPRPASVLVKAGEADLIRRAETDEDVFRRDQVPARLR